jgi:hypothetical protein
LVFWLALLVQKVEILTPEGQDAFADHVHPLPYVYEEMIHALLHRICPQDDGG